jgi:hypothetical protein
VIRFFSKRDQGKRREPEAGPELDRSMERLILGKEPGSDVPPYSTNDAAAVALATRFSRERGWWHFEKREVYGGWSVGWIEESQPLLVSVRPIRASAPTRALAICRSLWKVAGELDHSSEPRSRGVGVSAPLRV